MMQSMLQDVIFRVRNAKNEFESAITSTGVNDAKNVHSRELLSHSLMLLNVCDKSTSLPTIKVCISSVSSLIKDLEELRQRQEEKDRCQFISTSPPTSSSSIFRGSLELELTKNDTKSYDNDSNNYNTNNINNGRKSQLDADFSKAARSSNNFDLHVAEGLLGNEGEEVSASNSNSNKMKVKVKVEGEEGCSIVEANDDSGWYKYSFSGDNQDLTTRTTTASDYSSNNGGLSISISDANDVCECKDETSEKVTPSLKIHTGDITDISKAPKLGRFGGQLLLSHIVGNKIAKQSLMENIVLQFKLPLHIKEQLFQGLRRKGSNVLLYGPPGCGKTLLAVAAANESKASFFPVKPSEILSKYQGESERFIQSLFSKAYRERKSIIFFDEFDSITCARGQSDEGGAQSRALLAELLLQLSEHKERNKHHRFDDHASHDVEAHSIRQTDSSERQLVIIAATNRIEDVDEAIQRRFESKIYCGLPNAQERFQLIQKFLENISFDLSPQSMNEIVSLTEDWSGSDIENLVRETVMIPLRKIMPTLLGLPENMDSETEEWVSQIRIAPVTYEDFLTARDALLTPEFEHPH